MSTVAVALGGFGVIALMIAFIWWLVRWGRADEETIRRVQLQLMDHKHMLEQRDDALEESSEALDRAGAEVVAMRRQLADATELVEQLAAKHPKMLTEAIRDQLARLKALTEDGAEEDGDETYPD